MHQNNTKPMIAAGVMAGVLFVLNTINYYMPMLGIFTAFVVVVPPAILGRKYGIKWSTLAVVVSLLLQAILLGPQSVLVAATMAILGIVFGIAYHKDWAPAKRFLVPSLVFPLSILFQVLVATYVMGVDLSAMWGELMKQNLDSQELFMQARGMSPEQIAAAMPAVKQQLDYVVYVIPTLVVMSGAFLSYINVQVTDWFFRRFKLSYKPFPPVSRWYMPEEAAYVFVIGLLLVYWGDKLAYGWLKVLSMNLITASLPLILIQGLAFAKYLFNFRNIPSSVFFLMVGAVVIIPFFAYILAVFGIFDMLTKYRKKRDKEIK